MSDFDYNKENAMVEACAKSPALKNFMVSCPRPKHKPGETRPKSLTDRAPTHRKTTKRNGKPVTNPHAHARTYTGTTLSTSSTAKKRPSSTLEHDYDLDPEDIHLPGENAFDDEDLEIDQTCDQVRHKITAFINNGGMKVTAFQRAIGVNAGSYGRFMKARGPDAGFDNGTYPAAYVFFKKREMAGVKMPTPAKKRKTSATGTKKTNGSSGADADEFDVSDIHLDGEDEQEVEIYDTCDDVRRKIAAHLRLPAVTQAAFLRALATSFPADAPRKLTAKQLNDFTAKKGPTGGNGSGVFYAAYVYFEKLRIKQGKKKGKKRVEMEEKWGPGKQYGEKAGFPTKEVRYSWCRLDERPFMDQYGVMNYQKTR